MIDIKETLALFMELQTLGDRVLRKLAFDHVVHSIRKMNQKHKNDTKNRALQNIVFAMLQVYITNHFHFLFVCLITTMSCSIGLIIRILNHSKRMKQKPRDRSLRYASFTGERCGSMIEPQMPFVPRVFIHRQGSNAALAKYFRFWIWMYHNLCFLN
jgi:hypothetical protein